MAAASRASLLSLPSEVIDLIVRQLLLDVDDLHRISTVSRRLRHLTWADTLWKLKIEKSAHVRLDTYLPAESYRDLYRQLSPYWVLVRNRLWISGGEPEGGLAMLFFNKHSRHIEGYTLTARHGPTTRPIKFHDQGQTCLTSPVVVGLGIYERPILCIEPKQQGYKLDDEAAHEFDKPWRLRLGLINHPQTGQVPSESPRICIAMLAPDAGRWIVNSVQSTSLRREEPPSPQGHHTARRNAAPWTWEESLDPRTLKRLHMQGQLSAASFWTSERNQTSPSIGFDGDHSPDNIVLRFWGAISECSLSDNTLRPWQGMWCGNYHNKLQFFFMLQDCDRPTSLSNASQEAQKSQASAKDHLGLEAVSDKLPPSHLSIDSKRPHHDNPWFRGSLTAVMLTGESRSSLSGQSCEPLSPASGDIAFRLPDLGLASATHLVTELPHESVDEALDSLARPVYQVIEHHISHMSFHAYPNSELVLINKNAMAMRSVMGDISLFERIDIDRIFLGAQSLGVRRRSRD